MPGWIALEGKVLAMGQVDLLYSATSDVPDPTVLSFAQSLPFTLFAPPLHRAMLR